MVKSAKPSNARIWTDTRELQTPAPTIATFTASMLVEKFLLLLTESSRNKAT